MRTRQVHTLSELVSLAMQRRSVVSNSYGGVLPAAWVANMQAIQVHRMIECGMYLYDSPKASYRRWLRGEKEEA